MMRAGRSAARSCATGCGSTAATGSFQPRRPAQGTCGSTPTPATFRTGTIWRTTVLEPRSVQGRDIWSGRLTGQVTHEEPRHVLSGAAAAMRGLDPHDRRGGLPSTRRRLGRTWLECPVSRSPPRVLRPAVRGDAGDLVESADQPDPARSRLFPVRLHDQRRHGDGLAGRHLRPDPCDGAVGDRRPQCQLRLPRRQQLSCPGRHAERLSGLTSPT